MLYKAAGRALLVNGGARTNATSNLIVNCGIGTNAHPAQAEQVALTSFHEGKIVVGQCAGSASTARHRALAKTAHALTNLSTGIFNMDYDMDAYPGALQTKLEQYDNGTLKRGDVGDFVWRTEQAVGAADWHGLFTTGPAFSALRHVNR